MRGGGDDGLFRLGSVGGKLIGSVHTKMNRYEHFQRGLSKPVCDVTKGQTSISLRPPHRLVTTPPQPGHLRFFFAHLPTRARKNAAGGCKQRAKYMPPPTTHAHTHVTPGCCIVLLTQIRTGTVFFFFFSLSRNHSKHSAQCFLQDKDTTNAFSFFTAVQRLATQWRGQSIIDPSQP